MADMKTWARVGSDGAVIEVMPPLPADLVPGTDVFAGLTGFVDVTAISGIAPHWTQGKDGTFSPPTAEDPITLDDVKSGLKKQVDDKAEDLRLTLITPGSGQAMEYQEAYAQAQAALNATGSVSPSDYPMLAATVGVDFDPETEKPATDVLGVARSVKAAYEAYLQAGAAIRGVRLRAKAVIEAATSESDARAAFAAIAWPKLT